MKHKYLFWCQGAGEFAIAKELLDYVIFKGDTALLALDAQTIRVLSVEDRKKYGTIMYDLNKFNSRGDFMGFLGFINNLVEFYQPDVFVIQPSRTWQANMKRPNVKYCIGLECNILFQGVVTTNLDRVTPDWLDHLIVTFDEKYMLEECRIAYGIEKLPATISDKVKAFGWFQPRRSNTKKGDYIFYYTGSGQTGNQGWLQKVMNVIPKDQKVIAVSDDIIVGNFPNLQLYPRLATADFEKALLGAKWCIFHEGYGSIGKALMNKVPFTSIRNGTYFKYVETEPLNTLKWANAVDHDKITWETLQPKNISNMPLLDWGVEPTYELIKKNL